MILYETKDFSVVQPWSTAGLRIINKVFDRPVLGTGAFYRNMEGYDPDALTAAIKVADELQAGDVSARQL